MRRLALVGSLCTTLLAALPAAGGTILYATAPSVNRVDGFRVDARGGRDRIAAYPLDPKTGLVLAPKTGFTSCIQGRPNAAYRALLVRNSLLYVSEQLTPGRIANFPIDAGGGLGHDPTECSGQRPKVCNAGSRARRVCTTDDTDATTGCPGATCPGCCVALTLPISERRRIERAVPFLIHCDRQKRVDTETEDRSGRDC